MSLDSARNPKMDIRNDQTRSGSRRRPIRRKKTPVLEVCPTKASYSTEADRNQGSKSNQNNVSSQPFGAIKAVPPLNFTWVVVDELAGMGWPKSRDQVAYLVEEEIDHLVTLSADKIPPTYAFPELKWSLIAVEDFSGPSMNNIQSFLEIVDDARQSGEAIGVHCAEGRGRTGVMCACYLIYYHDLKPWDAIHVMRRQRPGSVERKVQEDTVVRFHEMIKMFGKTCISNLPEAEKQWKSEQRKIQQDLSFLRCENILSLSPSHLSANDKPWTIEPCPIDGKLRHIQRLCRSRSLPKSIPGEADDDCDDYSFRQHIRNFYQNNESKRSFKQRSVSRENVMEKRTVDSAESQATCVKQLIKKLRPVNSKKRRRGLVRNVKENMSSSSSSLDRYDAGQRLTRTTSTMEVDKYENISQNTLEKHYRDFMSGSSERIQRVRSLSQLNLLINDVEGTGQYDSKGLINQDSTCNDFRRRSLAAVNTCSRLPPLVPTKDCETTSISSHQQRRTQQQQTHPGQLVNLKLTGGTSSCLPISAVKENNALNINKSAGHRFPDDIVPHRVLDTAKLYLKLNITNEPTAEDLRRSISTSISSVVTSNMPTSSSSTGSSSNSSAIVSPSQGSANQTHSSAFVC